jgi:hypothetical protein
MQVKSVSQFSAVCVCGWVGAIAIVDGEWENVPLKLFSSSFSALARFEVGSEPARALRLRDSMKDGVSECGHSGVHTTQFGSPSD